MKRPRESCSCAPPPLLLLGLALPGRPPPSVGVPLSMCACGLSPRCSNLAVSAQSVLVWRRRRDCRIYAGMRVGPGESVTLTVGGDCRVNSAGCADARFERRPALDARRQHTFSGTAASTCPASSSTLHHNMRHGIFSPYQANAKWPTAIITQDNSPVRPCLSCVQSAWCCGPHGHPCPCPLSQRVV